MQTAQSEIQKKRRHFSKEEDEKLRLLVEKYGTSNWKIISQEMPNRSVRQCRERWVNNLSNDIEKSKWTKEEEELLRIKVHEIGPKWKYFQRFFPGRTPYDIRNRWSCLLRKNKVQNLGQHERFVVPMITHDDSPCDSFPFEIDNAFEFDVGESNILVGPFDF
ncbi:Myb-like DNA-binding domain containing protein [Histomonas meleagridis]|uniref:Myb-like DNA-binding domain containing protein n=1 Tax=Histomonas meleagridis TaxID=135588 RepID=UPI00355986C1|nr:Myb-like DNA-binding domain containing protein [Histomonas meleagridis]KAH0801708.1 Myb-like DNA-binding domain containing protein [Histomonas meleagridis]